MKKKPKKKTEKKATWGISSFTVINPSFDQYRKLKEAMK